MRLWSIVAGGLIAGLIAGTILGILLLRFSVPLITAAERYEATQSTVAPADRHSAAAEAANSDTHEDSPGAGGTRNLSTLAGSIILSTIYGLLLAVIFNLTAHSARINPLLRGLAFGLSGFAIVFLVPALALPPSPPGVEFAVGSGVRQLWWLAIVALGSGGIVAYRFILGGNSLPTTKRQASRASKHALGLAVLGVFIAIPFLIGPPNIVAHSVTPASLVREFRLTSGLIMLAFWSTLGLAIGGAYIYLVSNNSSPGETQSNRAATLS